MLEQRKDQLLQAFENPLLPSLRGMPKWQLLQTLVKSISRVIVAG